MAQPACGRATHWAPAESRPGPSRAQPACPPAKPQARAAPPLRKNSAQSACGRAAALAPERSRHRSTLHSACSRESHSAPVQQSSSANSERCEPHAVPPAVAVRESASPPADSPPHPSMTAASNSVHPPPAAPVTRRVQSESSVCDGEPHLRPRARSCRPVRHPDPRCAAVHRPSNKSRHGWKFSARRKAAAAGASPE